MATQTNYISAFAPFEFRHRKNNETVSYGEDSQALKQQLIVIKPPRILNSASSLSTTELELDTEHVNLASPAHGNSLFVPVFRSGCCSEIGPKPYNEDTHICIDNIVEHLHEHQNLFPYAGAFYGVFDGHGGTDAAVFIRENILRFIIEDSYFPACIQKATKSAFLNADLAFLDSGCFDTSCGTTALTAIIIGRKLLIANAGDCRAVLGRRGRAIELSNDHKPNRPSERARIEKFGGTVHLGYLNGQLSVSRALGDWPMKRSNEPTSWPMKHSNRAGCCALSAKPEVSETVLTEEDEFLIMGCDGVWDVMSSECAVEIARRELMAHNDPEMCSRELVREALKRNTCDNLTVVVVCFSADPPPRLEIPKSKFNP